MYLHCTKKLQDKLNIYHPFTQTIDYNEEEALYSWHANITTINRRQLLFFVNDATRYTIVIYQVKAKDFKTMDHLLKAAIRRAFEEEGYSQDCITTYFEHCGDVIFQNRANRNMVNRLNAASKSINFCLDELKEDAFFQSDLNQALTSEVISFGPCDYQTPKVRMAKALCKMMNHPEEDYQQCYTIEAYQLRIQLQLEDEEVYRTILIPSRSSFACLHNTIEKVYDWFNYHLHEFSVLNNDCLLNNPDYVPIKDKQYILVNDDLIESDSYFDVDKNKLLIESNTRLKDIFPHHKQLLYLYDFGDYWKHTITLEKVITDNHASRPQLLDRKGKRPPVDVGGLAGYEEYLKVISNPDDEDYESMLTWAESMIERDRTIDEINRNL